MARRSSIELDPRVRAAVDAALAKGLKIDAILEAIQRINPEISRSAIGRYSKGYREMATRERDVLAVAKAYAADFGDSTNPTGKLLIQMVTSLAVRTVMAHSEGDDIPDPKAMANLGRMVKDIAAAAKTDTERDAAIRKEERTKAAESAERAARSAGASEQVIDTIRREILGLAT